MYGAEWMEVWRAHLRACEVDEWMSHHCYFHIQSRCIIPPQPGNRVLCPCRAWRVVCVRSCASVLLGFVACGGSVSFSCGLVSLVSRLPLAPAWYNIGAMFCVLHSRHMCIMLPQGMLKNLTHPSRDHPLVAIYWLRFLSSSFSSSFQFKNESKANLKRIQKRF